MNITQETQVNLIELGEVSRRMSLNSGISISTPVSVSDQSFAVCLSDVSFGDIAPRDSILVVEPEADATQARFSLVDVNGQPQMLKVKSKNGKYFAAKVSESNTKWSELDSNITIHGAIVHIKRPALGYHCI